MIERPCSFSARFNFFSVSVLRRNLKISSNVNEISQLEIFCFFVNMAGSWLILNEHQRKMKIALAFG